MKRIKSRIDELKVAAKKLTKEIASLEEILKRVAIEKGENLDQDDVVGYTLLNLPQNKFIKC